MSVDQMLRMNEQQKLMDKLGVKSLDNLSKEELLRAGMNKKDAELIREREDRLYKKK